VPDAVAAPPDNGSTAAVAREWCPATGVDDEVVVPGTPGVVQLAATSSTATSTAEMSSVARFIGPSPAG
jgi:hypothetical protein